MLLVVRKIHMTHPFPRKDMIQRRKKMTPNKSTTRGCWGGNFAQWSAFTTSRRSSGKLSICEAPECWIIILVNKVMNNYSKSRFLHYHLYYFEDEVIKIVVTASFIIFYWFIRVKDICCFMFLLWLISFFAHLVFINGY